MRTVLVFVNLSFVIPEGNLIASGLTPARFQKKANKVVLSEASEGLFPE